MCTLYGIMKEGRDLQGSIFEDNQVHPCEGRMCAQVVAEDPGCQNVHAQRHEAPKAALKSSVPCKDAALPAPGRQVREHGKTSSHRPACEKGETTDH
mmetsp:Transcript_49601/g.115750  ORF Transcript_49601/g.115750 Transcript_49601/m.115750 type:complete len:97 (+) Transcript_49601:206-496(+)